MAEAITWRGDKIYVVLREPDPKRPGKTKTVWHAGSTHGFHDEETAKAWRDQRRVEVRRGQAVARDRLTVGEFLDEWLPAHALTKDMKQTSVESYAEKIPYIQRHPVGSMQVQLVKPTDVKRMYTDLLTKGGARHQGLSKRTVEYVGTIFKMAMRSAVVEYGLIPVSPAEHVAIPRPRPTETATWTADQMQRLVAVIRMDRYGRLFVTQSATGARRGELMALRWENVDLDGGWIHFRSNRVKVKGGHIEHTLKGDRPKTVKIDEATVMILRDHRKAQVQDRLKAGARWLDADYVFANVYGGPMNTSNLARYWKAIIEKAKVPYRKPHALRHTHATLLLEAGVPAHVVAERLGHKDVTTTFKVYAHVTSKQQNEAAETYAKWLSI